MFRQLLSTLLTALLAAGCGQAPVVIEIPFVATFGAATLACGAFHEGVEMTDLRLYLSDIRLVTDGGDEVEVRLEADGQWQQGDLAMLDFEDGSAGCNNGTAVTNETLRGTVPTNDYAGLRFVVGVPFDRNHRDPLQATAPLDDAAMHWHWRGGYKFLRAGVRTNNDGFWIHLGSTGCEGSIQNITGCRAPNRITVDLEHFNIETDAVRVDLAALVDGTDLADGNAGDCSSSPAEDSCTAPFAALGLGSKSQHVFSRQVGY